MEANDDAGSLMPRGALRFFANRLAPTKVSVMDHSDFFLCRMDELAEGQARGFDPSQRGRDTVFALVHQGQVRIYRNSCPHLDVRLEYRKDRFLSADGQLIVCYAHGAQFLPDTGECVYGPCLGQRLDALSWHLEEGWVVLEMPVTTAI
jgi:nitrite reductase/ring-hydroxylating ferredoxin subunit